MSDGQKAADVFNTGKSMALLSSSPGSTLSLRRRNDSVKRGEKKSKLAALDLRGKPQLGQLSTVDVYGAIMEAVKKAFHRHRTHASSAAHDAASSNRFRHLIKATVICLSQLLEMTAADFMAPHTDEMMRYLRVTMDLEGQVGVRLIDWLIHWVIIQFLLTDQFVIWSIDWLVGWLIGYCISIFRFSRHQFTVWSSCCVVYSAVIWPKWTMPRSSRIFEVIFRPCPFHPNFWWHLWKNPRLAHFFPDSSLPLCSSDRAGIRASGQTGGIMSWRYLRAHKLIFSNVFQICRLLRLETLFR